MKRLEKALKADLATWGAAVEGSALAESALLMARRLDDGPADREATALARELRLTMGELRGLAGDRAGELEAFLASVAIDEFGGR